MNFQASIAAAQAAVAGNPVRVSASASQPEQAEIMIYDVIGEDFWTGEGVTAKAIISALNSLGGADVLVRMNSRGGDTMDGTAIFNAFADYKGKTTGRIEGYACSMMTGILCAFDEVEAPDNILFMAHRAQTYSFGTAKDFRDLADQLDKVDQSIVSMYAQKTKKTPEEINALLDQKRDTWMTAQEAKDFGFIDKITVPARFSACLDAKFAASLAKDEGAMLLPANCIPERIKNVFGGMKAEGVVRIDADFVAVDVNQQPESNQTDDVVPEEVTDSVAGEPPSGSSETQPADEQPEQQPEQQPEGKDPVTQERERAKAIRAACKAMGLDDMADQYIDDGLSIEIVNRNLLSVKSVMGAKTQIDNKHTAHLDDRGSKAAAMWDDIYAKNR